MLGVLLCMRRNIYTRPDLAARIVLQLDLSPGMKIADLGCGDGVFLEAIVDRLIEADPLLTLDEVASSVFGVDIERSLASRATVRLRARYGSPTPNWNVISANALTLDETQRFDAITGNPPWMRIHHMDSATKALARGGFAVAKGAYDLYHLFIEKSVRLLKPGGQLAIVVPQALRFGPASAPTRELLSSEGEWTLSALSADEFSPRAIIRPALLTLRKLRPVESNSGEPDATAPTLGSMATVTTGVPTGSDSVFIVDECSAKRWRLEEHRLKPVVRGRDVRNGTASESNGFKMVWPYSRDTSGKWTIDDLSDAPNTLKYLETHRPRLSDRPRLASFVKRNPLHWYRFIDPNRHHPLPKLKIVVPDVFRKPAFGIIENPDVIVHNTCFQIIPRTGFERTLLDVVQSAGFWDVLRSNSRPLQNNYRRTSVSELKEMPLNC